MSGAAKHYWLRLCSVVATPPVCGSRDILEFACLDVHLKEGDFKVGSPQSWRFRPDSFVLPPADMVAGLTLLDLPTHRCSCTPENLKAILCQGGVPDVFVAHGASPLRVLVPDCASAGRPWICTHKTAIQLWPTASGHTLDELASWLAFRGGLSESAPEITPGRAVPSVILIGQLLKELLKIATLNQLLLFSNVICKPLGPPPLPSDKAGWALLPDDDLHWFAQQNISLPPAIRGCARREKARRVSLGRPDSLKFAPPSL
jgi:hypothetical protein